MSWSREAERWALVELVTNGRLLRSLGHAKICDRVIEARWCMPASRRDEVTLIEQQRGAVEALLDNKFPQWRSARDAIIAAGLPISARGAKLLRERERGAARVPLLPSRVNRKTAMAAVADHSKATLTKRRADVLDGHDLMRDGTIRMRPHAGMIVRRGDRLLDADVLSEVLGELIVTERALATETKLQGAAPRAVLFVENLGAYVDLVAPPGFLVVYVPGWDVSVATMLLAQLPGRGDQALPERDVEPVADAENHTRVNVPILHFGDLDPSGVEIMRHLRAKAPDLQWVVPDFWSELFPFALIGAWPSEVDVSDTPELVQRLASSGRWLEQEPVAVDPRLTAHLEAMIAAQ